MNHLLKQALQHIQSNQIHDAITCYKKLLGIDPNNIDGLLGLGNLYQSKKQYSDAVIYFKKLVELLPDNAITYYNLGVLYYDSHDYQHAKQCYKKAIYIDREFSLAHNNLGMIYESENKVEKAIKHYQQAVNLSPDYIEPVYNLGHLYQSINTINRAIDYYTLVLDKQQSHILAHNNLSIIYELNGDLDKCHQHLNTALTINPNFTDALCNKATLQFKQGYFNDSMTLLQNIIAHSPNCSEAYYKIAVNYDIAGLVDKACENYEKTIEIQPEHLLANINLALIYQKKNKLDTSLSIYKKIYQQHPNHIDAALIYVYLQQTHLQWTNIAKNLSKVKQLAHKKTTAPPILSPYLGLTVIDDPVAQKALTVKHNKVLAPPQKVYSHTKLGNKRKLRIGYISPDFRCHAVGLLIRNILPQHTKEDFTIITYALTHKKDDFQVDIENHCDQYINLSKLPHCEAAKKIYDDKIDILIDLAGHTEHARPEIFKYRPAPIQCHYIGYPATLGLDEIDYAITHEIMMPEQMSAYFTEGFVYLPETYIAVDNLPPVTHNVTRDQYGLPEDKFIFNCFNACYRIDYDCFKAWMHILTQVDNSILWLQNNDKYINQRIKYYANKLGVDPNRIYIGEKKMITDNWHNLLADLALDTFAMSGGTLGILNAWSGLPQVTLAGISPQSRLGAISAHGAQMDNMIAYHVHDFIQNAAQLALDKQYYQQTREKLSNNKTTAPLFKPARFIKHLELAYQMMWHNFCGNKQSRIIRVPSNSPS